MNAGPEGNVEPNTILVIPRGEDPLTLDVTNPEETRGGKRDEFPRVVKADVNAATKAIDAKLASGFAERVADPSLVADGTTVFPMPPRSASHLLRRPGYAPRQGDRNLRPGGDGDGTVLAVDEAAVQEVAEANVGPQVQAGYTLIDGSSEVDPAPGVVEDGTIHVPRHDHRPPGARGRPVRHRGRDPGQEPDRGQGHPRPVRSIRAVRVARLGRHDPHA